MASQDMEDATGTSETKVLTARSETEPIVSSEKKRESKTWRETFKNLVQRKPKKKKLDKNKSHSQPCVVPPDQAEEDEEKKNGLVKEKSKSCYDMMSEDKSPRQAKNENSILVKESSRPKKGNEPKQTNNEKYFRLENQLKQPAITREQMPKAEDQESALLQGIDAGKKPTTPPTTEAQIRLAKVEDHETALLQGELCYEIDRKKPIGIGARGTCVLKGRNTKDGRQVAIKKIHCYTEEQSSQYKKEIEILLKLRHCPNIVNYLEVHSEKDIVYIVLELMEGTLETLVGRPDLEFNFVEMSCDVLTALQFLHEKGIVHRDIKPRNILFNISPKIMLKLADFGLSKLEQSETSSFCGGTRCWMAPEVHQSLRQFFKESDIFSAGLVVHYLMTSKHPFAPDFTCNKENRSLFEHKTVDNILNHKLNAVSCLPSDALHLIRQMVKHDKNQRPDADKVLAHPFFWSNHKKMTFLGAVANQPEVGQEPSDFKKDVEMTQSSAKFQTVPWSEQSHAMAYLYHEMMKARKRKYNTSSVADLLRFIRNARQHVSELGRTPIFQTMVLRDSIFLKEFDSLFIEVYEIVLKHEWDQNKQELEDAMS